MTWRESDKVCRPLTGTARLPAFIQAVPTDLRGSRSWILPAPMGRSWLRWASCCPLMLSSWTPTRIWAGMRMGRSWIWLRSWPVWMRSVQPPGRARLLCMTPIALPPTGCLMIVCCGGRRSREAGCIRTAVWILPRIRWGGERCLALGARGIKLHPRAQAFGFGDRPAEAIWRVAQTAKVPILIHAGRGMPRMDPLADLALRFPDVVLVLAHAAIADQGMFASRLRDHPNVVYDTSTFSVFDQLELSLASPPSGSCLPPTPRMGGRWAPYTALRIGTTPALMTETPVAGRRDDDRHTGGASVAAPTPPRVPQIRPISGRLARVNGYIMMSFAAASAPDRHLTCRAMPFIALARAACRDPDPGVADPRWTGRRAARRAEQLLADPAAQRAPPSAW